MDDRLDITSMYGGAFIQEGGDPISPRPKKTMVKTYSPTDDYSGTAMSLEKLFKANRLLQKELNEVKSKLDAEKRKNDALEKVIKSQNLV